MKTIWDIIRESKKGKDYVKSPVQYENLETILSSMSTEEISRLGNELREKTMAITHTEEFNKLHHQDGGIVEGGDDCFYMDFGNWVVAQGEELYNDFLKNGHSAVLEYIKKHNIPEEEFTFECMAYAFQV